MGKDVTMGRSGDESDGGGGGAVQYNRDSACRGGKGAAVRLVLMRMLDLRSCGPRARTAVLLSMGGFGSAQLAT